MGGVIGAGVGAGLGLVNHNQQKADYNRQTELAAQQEALSPWTGVHGQMPKAVPGTLQSILQGGLSGASMGMMAGGGGANPMAGAQQVGVDPSLSPVAQGPGAGMMAGAYEQKPSAWSVPLLMGGGSNRMNG